MRRAVYRGQFNISNWSWGALREARVLTIRLIVVDFCCLKTSNSELSFLAAALYSSALARLSVCSGVSPVQLGWTHERSYYLQPFGFCILTSLQITEPGDKLRYLLPLERRVVITLDMMFRPDGTDERFAVFDPLRLCLCVMSQR
jgi:hypothetical protein